MPNKKKSAISSETSIQQLYQQDPIKADQLLWGRQANPISRRGFLSKSSVMALGAALGLSLIHI